MIGRKENFSFVNQRLSDLSQRMFIIEKAVSSELGKIAESFKKSMDEHLSIINVFSKESEARTRQVDKGFAEIEKVLKKAYGAMAKQGEALDRITKLFEELLRELEEEEN